MRTVLAALVTALLALLARPTTATAQAPDYGKLVAGIASRFLVPSYESLAAAGRDNAAAWRAECSAGGKPALAPLQEKHRALALAFARVQSFRFGPVGEGSTAERLYFWPERKGAVAKGLTALMTGTEPLDQKRIAQASAAARGIPALERLAFPERAVPPEGRACEAGVAISADLSAGLDEVAAAWVGIAEALAAGRLDPKLAPDMQQAAARLVTDFMTALAVIQDQKIEPILGGSADAAKPALAEARRSQLGRAMILANLAGLQAFVAALQGGVEELPRRSWSALLARLTSDAEALGDYPAGVDDPLGRKPAEAFLGDLREIRAILKDEVPAVLGLQIGFNGLDGD